jgi:molecular chaperone DnaK (HSP70)
MEYPHCYHPLIRRNTPLPVTRTEKYYTAYPGQTAVEIQIFQGDDEDALNNLLVGDFRIEGLTGTKGPNEVLCRMSLDVEGILHVSAIEKLTGKSKQITIAGALHAKSEAEIAEARRRVEDLFATHEESGGEFDEEDEDDDDEEELSVIDAAAESELVEAQHTNGKAIPIDAGWAALRHEAVDLLQRSRTLIGRMHVEDQAEASTLQKDIEKAVANHDSYALGEALRSLKELLFFVEGA